MKQIIGRHPSFEKHDRTKAKKLSRKDRKKIKRATAKADKHRLQQMTEMAEFMFLEERVAWTLACIPAPSAWPLLEYQPRRVLGTDEFLTSYFERRGGRATFKGRTRKDGTFFAVDLPVDEIEGAARNVTK